MVYCCLKADNRIDVPVVCSAHNAIEEGEAVQVARAEHDGVHMTDMLSISEGHRSIRPQLARHRPPPNVVLSSKGLCLSCPSRVLPAPCTQVDLQSQE